MQGFYSKSYTGLAAVFVKVSFLYGDCGRLLYFPTGNTGWGPTPIDIERGGIRSTDLGLGSERTSPR